MRSCPACRRTWPGDLEACPDCLASLVDDLDATLTCGQCGHVCPARMQTCPSCFALLRAEDIDLSRAMAHAVTSGNPMHRPPGRRAFAEGPACTVQRLAPGAPLLLVGPDELVEASLEGSAPHAVPPLSCVADDQVLFRLEHYAAAEDALVAVGGDGASIATFLRSGSLLDPTIEVRDETSAPVARLRRAAEGIGWELVETGSGAVLADVDRIEIEGDRWVDDAWQLSPTDAGESGRPLTAVALIALTVAVKVLFGRSEAFRLPDPGDAGPWGQLRL